MTGAPHDGKGTALVVGGSGGIGQGVCATLAREGWDIAITYRTGESRAQAAAQAVRALGRRAEIFALDLGQADAAPALIDAVVAESGRPRQPGLCRRAAGSPDASQPDRPRPDGGASDPGCDGVLPAGPCRAARAASQSGLDRRLPQRRAIPVCPGGWPVGDPESRRHGDDEGHCQGGRALWRARERRGDRPDRSRPAPGAERGWRHHRHLSDRRRARHAPAPCGNAPRISPRRLPSLPTRRARASSPARSSAVDGGYSVCGPPPEGAYAAFRPPCAVRCCPASPRWSTPDAPTRSAA